MKLGWEPQAIKMHEFHGGCCWYLPPGCYHQIVDTGTGPIKIDVSYFQNDGRPISHALVSQELTAVAQLA